MFINISNLFSISYTVDGTNLLIYDIGDDVIKLINNN